MQKYLPIKQEDFLNQIKVSFAATKILCLLAYPDSTKEQNEAFKLLNIEIVEALKEHQIEDIDNPTIKALSAAKPEEWQEKKIHYIEELLIPQSNVPDNTLKFLPSSKSLNQIKGEIISNELMKEWNTA